MTVPVLFADGGRVYTDSADIARFADAEGDGPTLFPAEHATDIAGWIDVSERALSAPDEETAEIEMVWTPSAIAGSADEQSG